MVATFVFPSNALFFYSNLQNVSCLIKMYFSLRVSSVDRDKLKKLPWIFKIKVKWDYCEPYLIFFANDEYDLPLFSFAFRL
jgi:hypothetical protein